jgi:hypothetical protein
MTFVHRRTETGSRIHAISIGNSVVKKRMDDAEKQFSEMQRGSDARIHSLSTKEIA